MTDKLLSKLKALPLIWQILGVMLTIAAFAYVAGLGTPDVLALPFENEKRSLANERGVATNAATIASHAATDAHDGSVRSDSLIVEMVRDLGEGMMAHFDRLLCIERLDRQYPTGLPAQEFESRCPPPSLVIPGGGQ